MQQCYDTRDTMPTRSSQTRSVLLASFGDIVGSDHVVSKEADLLPYNTSTGEFSRVILGAVRPCTVAEIIKIIEIATTHNISLYPISTGRNWGYGTAKPVTDNCVILDLSRMQRIIECDTELGVVTLEPGVTQQQLYEYLTLHNLPFVVPTTGAGPNTSIVGNILERGYGLAPYTDHFSAVTSLEAVLPDGSVYRPALAELGAYETEKAFKYGLGAYLDGLFTQSNFGIVTQVTILLKRRSPRTDLFVFWVDKKEDLEKAITATRTAMSSYETIVPTIKIISQLRSFAVTNPYPKNLTGSTGTLDPDTIGALARRALITPWVGIGIISGEEAIVTAARKGIRKILRKEKFRYAFFGQFLMRFILFFTTRSPMKHLSLAASFNRIADVMGMFNGKPDFTEHHIDYWKSGKPFPKDQTPDPARDGTGLFWYAPLVPMKPALVQKCITYIETLCRKHGIEPLITISALSSTCLDVTTYLLFDAKNPVEVTEAHECYTELFMEGSKLGLLPYRLNIDFMDLPQKLSPQVWRVVDTLKKAIDPQNIIAPGRYSSSQKPRKARSS